MIKVVCGVIYRAGKVFIARRKPEKVLGGYWEFPGGKVEEGETHETTLKRELDEELGMMVQVEKYLTTSEHDYGKFQIQLHAYQCDFISATFEMIDHDVHHWVEPNLLLKLKLAPADVPIAKYVQKGGKSNFLI